MVRSYCLIYRHRSNLFEDWAECRRNLSERQSVAPTSAELALHLVEFVAVRELDHLALAQSIHDILLQLGRDYPHKVFLELPDVHCPPFVGIRIAVRSGNKGDGLKVAFEVPLPVTGGVLGPFYRICGRTPHLLKLWHAVAISSCASHFQKKGARCGFAEAL
jgi:hypothetical protein